MNKRKHNRFIARLVLIAMMATSVATLALNEVYFKSVFGFKVGLYGILIVAGILGVYIAFNVVRYHSFKWWRKVRLLRDSVEDALLEIGVYLSPPDQIYKEMPSVKVTDDLITVDLASSVDIRERLERHLERFSTALPGGYVVTKAEFTRDANALYMLYEDINEYQQECYTLEEYRDLVSKLDANQLYFDSKNIIDISQNPHFLVCGSTGSGKTYMISQLILGTGVFRSWNVLVLDCKRTYGKFKKCRNVEVVYDIADILHKVHEVEAEIKKRYAEIEPMLDDDSNKTASDFGYPVLMVVVEEYISLQTMLDKKELDDLNRGLKNIAGIGRQASVVLVVCGQTAGVDVIPSNLRSNLGTRILLGDSQSNVRNTVYGNSVIYPDIGSFGKGEGFIGTAGEVSLLRVPAVDFGGFATAAPTAAAVAKPPEGETEEDQQDASGGNDTNSETVED